MGLDMYLTARRRLYVGEWNEDDKKKLNEKVRKIFPEMYKTGNLDSIEVDFEAGYWRKANQIHGWFVDNVQDGSDNCGEYWVDRDKLETLKDLCQQVMNVAETADGKICNGERLTAEGWKKIMVDGVMVTNPEDVAEILPPQGGFFFGPLDINEYYLYDIKNTIEIIDKCLALPNCYEFYYSSSW